MPWYIWRGWWLGSFWVFRTIIIVFIVWIVVRAVSASREGREQRATPEEVLRQRYARGEIDTQEYQHRLEVLRHPGN